MSSYQYYEELKALARQVRADNGLVTPRVLRIDLHRIFRKEKVKVDLRPGFREMRGAYFNDECGASVVIAKGLPLDPAVFTMAHELKHHLLDRDNPYFQCDLKKSGSDPIEIGAEIFAAELIFPEGDFLRLMNERGVGRGDCTAEDLVRLKHDTRTTLSYAALVKRAEYTRVAERGVFAKVPWKRIEEQIYGKPFRRARKRV